MSCSNIGIPLILLNRVLDVRRTTILVDVNPISIIKFYFLGCRLFLLHKGYRACTVNLLFIEVDFYGLLDVFGSPVLELLVVSTVMDVVYLIFFLLQVIDYLTPLQYAHFLEKNLVEMVLSSKLQ